MSSMINLKSDRKTGTINVGVSPITNINVNSNSTETKVQYQPPAETTQTDKKDPEKEALLREINVLKLIIDIQHSNPIVVNKYIIADDEALGKMVGLLCNASEVHLDADDVTAGCISKKIYRKVNSIYVVVNGETLNLKYDFPAVMKTLKDLHISTKYVF